MTDKPTLADRDAAAPFAFANGYVATMQLRYDIRRGERDGHPLVQAFMRHRLATEAAKDAEIAELVELLRELQDFVQGLSSRFAHPLGSLQQINEILAKHGGGNE